MGKAMSTFRTISPVPTKCKDKLTFPKTYQNSSNNIERVAKTIADMPKIAAEIQKQPLAEYTEMSNRFDFALNERLKQIHVASENTNSREISPSKKSLPLNKSSLSDEVPHLQGNYQIEPEKLTLDQLDSLLLAYQKNPDEWTLSKISEYYNIKIKNTEKLLKYFGSFDVYIPDPQNKDMNETISGVKISKQEPIPNQITPTTGFEDMQKIMGFRKKTKNKQEDRMK